MLTSAPYSRGLFERHVDNPIIRARDIPYRCNTVFNAAAALVDGETVLLMRVEDMRGHSHLTVARSKDGVTDWQIDPQPSFVGDPDHYPEEIWGVEDPRITYLEEQDRWAITYTAFSVGGPLVSLATTRDFKTFQRLGPVMPPEIRMPRFSRFASMAAGPCSTGRFRPRDWPARTSGCHGRPISSTGVTTTS